jgi:cytochrome c oxidase subunit III
VTERIVSDVSALPTYEFGAKSPIWWGTLGFVALEGMGFALAAAMYLYLATISQDWPLGAPPPDLLPGTLTTLILLASAIPNRMLDRWARAEDLRLVRIGLVVMCAFGIAPLIVRIFEFRALHVSWDTNAYGSVTWLLLGLHASHLLTDLGDTLVLTALMFTRYGHSGKRLSDVSDNAFYWDFVVVSWVLLYILIYWFPRVWSP